MKAIPTGAIFLNPGGEMVSKVFLAIAMLICGSCSAGDMVGDTTGVTLPDDAMTPNHDFEYSAAGRSVGGRLSAYEFIPDSHWPPPSEGEEWAGPVRLCDYLWYPTPFSSPSVFVIVTEPSDFRLDILDGQQRLEEFEFDGIAAGVYIFGFAEPLLPKRRCRVRLVLDGDTAGEVQTYTDYGGRTWGRRGAPAKGQSPEHD